MVRIRALWSHLICGLREFVRRAPCSRREREPRALRSGQATRWPVGFPARCLFCVTNVMLSLVIAVQTRQTRRQGAIAVRSQSRGAPRDWQAQGARHEWIPLKRAVWPLEDRSSGPSESVRPFWWEGVSHFISNRFD